MKPVLETESLSVIRYDLFRTMNPRLMVALLAIIIAIVAIVILSLSFGSQLKQGSNANSAINLQPEYNQVKSTSSQGVDLTSTDWPMYHRDLAHTGSVQLPASTSIHQDWLSPDLDGAIYAEPLIEGNSVFVATENNSIYSLSAQTGSIKWRLHIGSPVPGYRLPCGDIDPAGITGTPVIDNASRTLYASVFLNTSPPKHYLASVNIDSGKGSRVIPIDPPGSDPLVEQQRAALSISNGTVYIPFGGLFGDCGDYHGYVVGAKNGTGASYVYQVPTRREGGFWAPSGPVTDASGNLYLTSGNGESTDNFDHGNTIIKLSPSLKELGFFAPSNWAQLNGGDTDLGSTSPALVGPNMLFQIGKGGIGYMVSADSPGGIGGQIFSGHVCAGAFGGTAYSSPYLFVPCSDGLYALKIGQSSFSVAWHSSRFLAGPPIVTGSLVWTVGTSSGTLYALDAADGHQVFRTDIGTVPHFVTPSANSDRVFVVSDNDKIASFLISQK